MDDPNAAFGIKKSWTDAGGGGIFWESRKNRHSKNACSNGPAAILAAHLYQAFGDKEDLEWAKKIYAWEKQHLFNPEIGAIYDNLNTQTGATNTRVYTYNQGTFIGAAVELYKITGDRTYINDAIKAADYTITTSINTDDNLLRSEGRRDGGLFKGIFIRYFAQLILSDGINDDVRNRYIAFLKHNGETLWREGTSRPKVLFGPYWKTAPENNNTGHTEHLSGCMLMEALALLQKQNKL
jgi:predicted alpha-1,6-mannanase (GH76 family)